MRKNKIVQFVCFNSSLKKNEFITEWDNFSRSAEMDADVTLQQSATIGRFNYIAQHRSKSGEFNFHFHKGRRSGKVREPDIKAKPAGGYSVLYFQKPGDADVNEKKIFVFIADPRTDLEIYKELSPHAKLNIYEAYYENCTYAYILEFFAKKNHTLQLSEKLKEHTFDEVGIYEEFAFHPA